MSEAQVMETLETTPFEAMFPVIPSTRSIVTICSVAPVPFDKERYHMRPLTEEERAGILPSLRPGQKAPRLANITIYKIPAVAKTDDPPYRTLDVYDTAQMCMLPNPSESVQQAPAPLAAIDVARSLVSDWGHNGLNIDGFDGGACALGVGIIKGRKPTPEELKKLNAQQSRYFTALVNKADQLWRQADVKNIHALHRTAALWLGVDHKQHEWLGVRGDQGESVQCIACAEPIRGGARVCKHCKTNLVSYCVDEDIDAAVIKEVDPILADIVANRRRSNSAKAASKK